MLLVFWICWPNGIFFYDAVVLLALFSFFLHKHPPLNCFAPTPFSSSIFPIHMSFYFRFSIFGFRFSFFIFHFFVFRFSFFLDICFKSQVLINSRYAAAGNDSVKTKYSPSPLPLPFSIPLYASSLLHPLLFSFPGSVPPRSFLPFSVVFFLSCLPLQFSFPNPVFRVLEIIQRLVSRHTYYITHYPLFAAQLHSFISAPLAPDFPEACAALLPDLEARHDPSSIKTMLGVTNLVEFLSTAPKPHPVPQKNYVLCLDVPPEEIARQLSLIGTFFPIPFAGRYF
jgi:hypothetical protein